MKKLNYFMLGLAGLALASCSQDDLQAPGQGDGNVNITVKLPADMGTRSLSDGLTADVLHIAVFDGDDSNAFVYETEASFGGAIQTTVSLNLPQNKNYNIAFFAVSEEADGTLYSFLPQGNADYSNPYIFVDYEAYGSDANLADAYDCFYIMEPVATNSGAVSKTVTLNRPVAQINWGTNDLSQVVVTETAFGENGKNLFSNLTIEDAPYQLDLFNGITDAKKTIEISALATPASEPTSAQWLFPVNPATYKYIAMQYVLAPATETIFDVSLDAYNAPDKGTATVTNDVVNVTNCPLQANYRTNIYGALLTNPNEFTVIKNNAWDGHLDPSLELAFQRGGSFTLEHDFTINEVMFVTKNLTIDLNGYNIYANVAADGFITVQGASLTVKGNGGIIDNLPNDDFNAVIGVSQGGTLTIEGGDYISYGEGQVIYVQEGTAYIKGGTYWLKEDTSGDNWCLNCQDANYKAGKANIYVTGGKFYNWNPADNAVEGPGINFVSTGYESIESTDGTNTVYTVVPTGTSMVTNDQELKEALSTATEGDIIYVAPGSYGILPTGWPAGVTVECAPGTIFNGQSNPNINGSSIIGATFKSDDYSLRGTVNGKFINCEFLGGFNNARWLYAGATAYFEGCLFSGSLYGCHFDGGANPLTFKSCTFQGFNTFGAAITLLTFESCTFETNGKSNYNGINCFGVTVMNNCNFTFDGTPSNEWIDPKKQLTMSNCKINGLPASSPDVKDYFVTDNYGNIIFN